MHKCQLEISTDRNSRAYHEPSLEDYVHHQQGVFLSSTAAGKDGLEVVAGVTREISPHITEAPPHKDGVEHLFRLMNIWLPLLNVDALAIP